MTAAQTRANDPFRELKTCGLTSITAGSEIRIGRTRQRCRPHGRIQDRRGSILSPQASMTQLITNVAHQVALGLVKARSGFKRYGFSHILLCTLGLVLYTLVGALVFQFLDQEAGMELAEVYKKRCRHELNNNFASLMERCGNRKFEECEKETFQAIKAVDSCLRSRAVSSGPAKPSLPMNLKNAVIFAASIYTTIGYGNIYPTTKACKIFTIVYMVFGIPYFLATVLAIGRFLEIMFMRLWFNARKWFQHILQRTKNAFQKNSNTLRVPSEQQPKEERKLVPFLVGMMATFAYILAQAAVFKTTATGYDGSHEFSLFDSFYFVIQSVALVGFGDLFPSDPSVLNWHLPIMFGGICFLSMCFFILRDGLMERTAVTSQKVSTEVSKLHHRVSIQIEPLRKKIRSSLSHTNGD